MSLTRRQLCLSGAAAGGAAGSAVVLAACGQRAEPGPGQSPVVQSATIRYATETGRVDSGIKDVVAAFKHDRIKVELEGVPSDFSGKVLTTAAAGDPFDVIHTHPRDYHAWINAGIVLPLEPYLKKDRQNVPDIVTTAMDYWNRDGQRWAVPYNLSVQNMYFNRDLFGKAGLKTPEQHEKDGTWTFDTYLDLARRLTSGSGESKIFGVAWMHANLDIQLGFIWPFGGDLWDKDGQKLLLDGRESLEAIQFQADLAAKHGISPTDEEWRQFSSAPSNTWGAAFSAGRAAMELQPNDSLAPHVIPAPFAKGVAPMPKGRAGRIVRGLAVGVHLLKGSKHHDAGWEFASFHAGKESEKIMLDRHVSLPWHKSSLNALEKTMPLLPWENAAAYAEGVRRLRPTPYVSKFSDINRVYVAGYSAVRRGEKTAVQMITELKPELQTLLRG